jgi:hypothetical protein
LAPFQGQVQQDVEVRGPRGGTHFLAVLERHPDGVVLVALSPLGQRLLRATWTRAGVAVEMAPEAAPYLDPREALRDLAFALWPPQALAAALKGGPFSAEFGAEHRVLRRGNRELLRVELRRDGDAKLWVLSHKGRPGEIRVRSVEEAQP